MSLEIKTSNLEPIRHTFANIARRFGEKPATRYQEATYDAQGTTNFHYKPLWDADKTLNDKTHSVIQMEDWYDLKDPRQFYYGTYVQNRARLQDTAEGNYKFFEKRELVDNLDEKVLEAITFGLIPLRHVEQTANLNYMYGAAYGYGTAITQACLYAGMDRLGMAQYLSRIGLLIDGNSSDSLQQGKEYWMNDEAWQGIRALCEHTLIIKDWFELFIAQSLVLDTVIHVVHYQHLDNWLVEHNGRDIAMLTEFMQDCFKDLTGWSNSTIKIVVAESEENKLHCQQWLEKWQDKVLTAYQPLIEKLFGAEQATAVVDDIQAQLAKRCKTVGLTTETAA
ncbi:aromatic/alkene monooxygenase hydroxylase subunit beta [Psychrobacter immobilis]|jgi:phenol hydroxylase P1 protein|uniref:aromatic/alkene monooxygenase hydroxylase subunit beta n=1 Tax=Psychrobacter immobilis TaxID=498 RepID=UPI00191A43ED|nr:aromatic/alkene monooxygenase hydroxylase subunit beta [Psychrobacter immobilis]